MRLKEILASETARSKGSFIIESGPPEKQPTAETIERLEREINAQLKANERVSIKSMNS